MVTRGRSIGTGLAMLSCVVLSACHGGSKIPDQHVLVLLDDYVGVLTPSERQKFWSGVERDGIVATLTDIEDPQLAKYALVGGAGVRTHLGVMDWDSYLNRVGLAVHATDSLRRQAELASQSRAKRTKECSAHVSGLIEADSGPNAIESRGAETATDGYD